MVIFAVIFIAALAIDLITKWVLTPGAPFDIIPGFVSGVPARNTGIAFSWFSNVPPWALALLSSSLLVIALAFYVFERRRIKKLRGNVPMVLDIGFALFFAGGIGNVVCRVGFGYVRDFLVFDFWPGHPIFNFADVFINISLVCLATYIIFLSGPRRKSKEKELVLEIETRGDGDGPNKS